MADEKERLSLRVDSELHRNFGIKCKIEGKTMTDIITSMIESYLDPNSKTNKVIEVRCNLLSSYNTLLDIYPH